MEKIKEKKRIFVEFCSEVKLFELLDFPCITEDLYRKKEISANERIRRLKVIEREYQRRVRIK